MKSKSTYEKRLSDLERKLGGKPHDEAKRNELAERFGSDIVFANNFDFAIIGVSLGFHSGRVVYDTNKMGEGLMEIDSIDYDDACEYIEYNVLGSYVVDNTPIYVQI